MRADPQPPPLPDGRPGHFSPWVPAWLGVLSHVAILAWGLFQARAYLEAGFFRPDFAVIHEAYRFGFVTFPLVLIAAGIVGCVLGSFHQKLWGKLVWWSTHGGGLFLAFGLLGIQHYVSVVEPRRLVIREFDFQSPHVSAPLRILHFSDLHGYAIGDFERRVFSRIRELDPDLVIFTGDWLQPIPPETFDAQFDKLIPLIRSLRPPLGFYGVYGDTDAYWYGKEEGDISPLIMLDTRPYLIEWKGGTIALRGLGLFQSRYADMAREPVRQWLNTVPKGAFTLLVGHAPDFAMAVSDFPVELCLAGHTHGGQVRLPWLGPLIVDSDTPLEWSRGNRQVNRLHLNVSAGLGSTHAEGLPSIRFLCPPEMTLITVRPE